MFGAGIIGPTRRDLGQHFFEEIEKAPALRPILPGDDQLCGHAIERGVVRDRGSHVFRLKPQLFFRVRTGNDDPGTDVSQFAGDRLFEQGVVVALAPLALGPIGPPDDHVVRMDRAGDVDFVHLRVLDGRGPHRRSAVDDPHESGLDQPREQALEDRTEILVHGVHLQQNSLALLKNFGKGVGCRNARDVASAEHEHGFGRQGVFDAAAKVL